MHLFACYKNRHTTDHTPYEVIMTKERVQYINSVHTCSLCSTVPLQYVLATDANAQRPEKKDQAGNASVLLHVT